MRRPLLRPDALAPPGPSWTCGAMQLRPNYGNVAFAAVALFFIYLFYVLFGPGAQHSRLPDGLSVDVVELANYCILAARAGGAAVRAVHAEKRTAALGVKAITKEGAREYVTKADLVSNQMILDILTKFPGLRIVSEEKTLLPPRQVAAYKQDKRRLWKSSQSALAGLQHAFPPHITDADHVDYNERQRLFLDDITLWVDPLDATQEFTEDLTEYVTVMVCVAYRGRPKFGVVYRPFQRELIWGVVDERRPYVYSSTRGELPIRAAAQRDGDAGATWPGTVNRTVLVSRSHAGGEIRTLLDNALGAGVFDVEPAGGSGYKTLRVLNATAALYVHATAVKKWDLCAGDALVTAAGGRAITLHGDQLTYFAADNPLNERGWLVAVDRPFAYSAKLKQHWLSMHKQQ